MKKIIPVLFISLIVVVFFWQFFIKGLLPIPADTIVGLYHPFRDLYAKDYPNGVPFKNFLITDPVRQTYPWRELAVSTEKKLELPLWNPYNFSGTPLLANMQSSVFYPFNILFFILPFLMAWSILIFLQPILAGLFLYVYLNNLKLSKWASLLGAISFSFSGFFIAWLEWGTVLHVGLWLPLILLSIDKIFTNLIYKNSKFNPSADGQNSKFQLKSKKLLVWGLVFIFSLTSSFFAGHLQTFFYLFVFSWIYFFSRWWQYGRKISVLVLYLILNTLYLVLSAVQWIPTLQLILLSARGIDQAGIGSPGWFIPWQHLIQFVAPDFFGNPTTLNYWGIWNYGELVGYVGIIPLILALFAMFCRRDKKTLFFGIFSLLSLVFSLPTFLAKIPYLLKIPFLDTAQPTRLLFITTFSLTVLSALGFDYFLKIKKRIPIIYPLVFILIILTGLWIFIPKEQMSVVKNNLLLPILLFICSSILLIVLIIFQKRNRYTMMICILIVAVNVFDLLRFGWKFNTFTQKSYLFPSTKTITFLQENLGEFRIMSTDSRILPPNFSAIYRVKSIDGYDPLYLLRYGELLAASERKKADISPPFGFNRIITPHNYDSKIIDLLGVKFVLSLSDLDSPKLKKVFQEGKTIIYENINVMPRAFFALELIYVNSKKEAIRKIFENNFNNNSAIVENSDSKLQNTKQVSTGKANIVYYSENKVIIETENSGIGFLVITDSFYPTWKVKIDSKGGNIHRTGYNFRGVIVPAGKHTVEFYNSLF